MISSLIRKIQQLINDPVLQKWLVGRLVGQWPKPASYNPHQPPYLSGLLPLPKEAPSSCLDTLIAGSPKQAITLSLAGESVLVNPGSTGSLFERTFDDIETLLSLHRFAWARQHDGYIDPEWFGILWQSWYDKFSVPDDSWAWHPYTAAERAVNVLRFANLHGLPQPFDKTLSMLADHARVISERLEYFGEHHTSNHLVNNGRGLYVLGLTLNMEQAALIGLKILLEEAERLFGTSWVLREDSTHYHLLLTRLYQNCAELAEKAGRPEASALRNIADKSLGAARQFMLTGGLALIGDISPDITPERLVSSLKLKPIAKGKLNGDGWLRFDSGRWSSLWHTACEGFSHMPGHGHQDVGSFETHIDGKPVIVDPGRGAYGESGQAALYRSSQTHNGLTMDGNDPFPQNRPYYDKTFRLRVGGPVPQMEQKNDTVTLIHHGFARFTGGGVHKRTWHFTENRLTIEDQLDGAGQHAICRRLITPLKARLTSDGIVLGIDPEYIIRCPNTEISIEPITRWTAYGQGEQANIITLTNNTTLPYKGLITLEALCP